MTVIYVLRVVISKSTKILKWAANFSLLRNY